MDSTNSATSPRSVINLSDYSSSPYYLHPNDNPGALLVSEIFSGDNYIAWSRSITMALTVKNKVAFINGSIAATPADQLVLHSAWLRVNNLEREGRGYCDSSHHNGIESHFKRHNVAPKLSEEERATRRYEMQVDVELHEEQRWKRLRKAEEDDG
ncbi:uncharacterized protein LOC122275959 isoform X1 [Carya illinoinensis]|uniref:uncharacterized protein LOC122275934 isoform X1 n=1 Tax=Carya illinoinensis TaxID=32201 RepID=UPI001C71ECB6|nr:uncharacterized protein LOC122275934 isoform X1 [Carya illinoinensis]XP_042941216.1 uncharacterized protein LOC122275934 isoform X1 [Carya illinoinensis]XP_042941247.1 uncharacterized protein LOC122275959 isoform X1 [Carya illinoinensis]XP_042941248.1 uncharacterized protein LOC122275959 isoform X1 [Carya illinoinensis]